MAKNKSKLELTWIGKENRPRLEPRILLEDAEKSYHAAERVSEKDEFDNRLIFGDNLLALKALEQEYSGQIQCIYIDPPFNTGAAFEHYDDGLEHSVWLDLMHERLEILKRLLCDHGVLFIHIDDKEMAYLRVLADEVMGRRNFLNMMVVKTSDPSGHKTVNPSPYSQTEYVLMYARDRNQYSYEARYVEADYDEGYNKFIPNIEDNYLDWEVVSLNQLVAQENGYDSTRDANKAIGRAAFRSIVARFAFENADRVFQPTAISNDAGRDIVEARNASRADRGVIFHVAREGYDDVLIRNGRQIYFYANKLREVEGNMVPAKPLTNLWSDIPYNGIAREGGVKFKNGKKPERLIWRCIDISTEPGDLVLDSFAGSGTTGAVAHKMGRRWIMVELGEHCHTHIIPRLKKVIDGEDPGGVTEATNWKGGGGFRYYRLAPSLLEKDAWDNWVISRQYDAAMLAQAMCKHEGFTYEPDANVWWKQGHASEHDFIYVTTQTLTREQIAVIHEELGDQQSLLICCSAFRADPDDFPNITLKKIPHAVLGRCEFGKDDYSLEVAALPEAEPEAGENGELFDKGDA